VKIILEKQFPAAKVLIQSREGGILINPAEKRPERSPLNFGMKDAIAVFPWAGSFKLFMHYLCGWIIANEGQANNRRGFPRRLT